MKDKAPQEQVAPPSVPPKHPLTPPYCTDVQCAPLAEPGRRRNGGGKEVKTATVIFEFGTGAPAYKQRHQQAYLTHRGLGEDLRRGTISEE